MGRHRQAGPSQGNTMDQYVTPLQRTTGQKTDMSVHGSEQGLTRPELLAAIHGSRDVLEGKKETVAIEVNLLHTDLHRFSNNVKVAEGSIAELQADVATLQKQMTLVTSQQWALDVRLEDVECRSCGNNVRLLGFWSKRRRHPPNNLLRTGFSLPLIHFFTIERAHRALVEPPRP
ncbi:hypothetical protein NDU88_000996 [Pleurodeles waltl]|uniref:Uncharacterized protein n=1 Tax=Pleurodeles waltl TaxID=8319 RepID=A0AAV7WJ61_PLEWA|nr:hypothetical protein NDU88_000996 [Pleurodeles waltl]